MDGDLSSLDQGFCYDVSDGIAALDVVSFLHAVRAIHPDSVEELCSNLDETEVISFNFLRKQIQDYAEEKRNSFTDDSETQDSVKDETSAADCTGNLEGCGGDISTAEPDFGDLLLKNSSLFHSNSNLRVENSQLRKQLDTCEEECEAQRGTIAVLEKELRQFQGSKPDVQQLIKEKDEMHSQIHHQEEEVSVLHHRCKVLKEESDDYRLRLSCLQDQYDSLIIVLDQTQKENQEHQQENEDLKSTYENNQVLLESKDEQITTKTEENRVLRDRIMEYESTLKDLQEEKETLLVQVREVQLEHSIYQKAVTGSAPGTPAKISIQHELAQAETEFGSSDYPSPLCGTNYVKGKQQYSPMMDTLRRSLVGSITSPPSFSKTPQKEPTKIQKSHKSVGTELEMQEKSTLTTSEERINVQKCNKSTGTELKMQEKSTLTASDAFADHKHMQTDPLTSSDSAVQTECEECETIMTQTEHGRLDMQTVVSSAVGHEDQLFEEQSNIIQGNITALREEKTLLEVKNGELAIALDREKNKIHYLNTQLSVNRAKIDKLQSALSTEQQKVMELTDINIKLCSGKLDMCLGELPDAPSAETQLDLRPSQLVGALFLDGPRTACSKRVHDLHGDCIFKQCSPVRTELDSCELISLACEADRDSNRFRCCILKRCRDLIEQALKQKAEALYSLLHEILYCEDCSQFDDVWEKRKWNTTFSENLRSLESLGTKLANVTEHIGAAREERKRQSAIKALTHRLSATNNKYEESQEKLRRLYSLSMECQCFSGIGMLSVLKDVKLASVEDDEITHKKEPVNLSHPSVQSQMQHIQKAFDELDKSIAATIVRSMPSKFRVMVLLFLLFAYSTFRWEDYHVPCLV